MFGIERMTATDSGSSDSNVATVTPAATDTTIVPGSSASAISRSRSGTIAGLTATTTSFAPATAVRFAAASASVAYDVTPGQPVELGRALGRAVRGADAAVDLDARLEQSREDGAGHRPGSEEGDGGQRHGRIGTHATILGLAV